MRCYRCNSPLTNDDFCVSCGADVTVYKMVARTSNSYYNLGLAKAEVRDLTGAISCLKTSLRLNKNNIKARNLLGLVYYETGEIVEALTQWVISRNLKPEKNAASAYIHKIQRNQNKFEAINQTVKRYNMALRHAQNQNYDLAVIQLKKIFTINPKMIKSLQLLALLLMKEGDYASAKKYLRLSLKVDKNNTISQRYLHEIELIEAEENNNQTDTFLPKKKKKAPIDTKPISGNDIIVPPTTYKEPSNGAITVINILIGVFIGAVVVWFLLTPARLQSQMQDYNKTLTEYSEQLSNSNAEISILESQIEQLEDENEKLKAAAENVGITATNVEYYDAVINAGSLYMEGKIVEACEAIAKVDIDTVTLPQARAIYNTLKEEHFASAAITLYDEGYGYYSNEDYDKAIAVFERSYQIDPNKVETLYYMASAYAKISNQQKATEYYQIIVENFSDSWYVNDAKAFLGVQ